MGLDLQHVLSDETHYGPFECAICQSLVDLDALITTTCSHCFCRQCLTTWLQRQHYNCPSCNGNLTTTTNSTIVINNTPVAVQPLQTCQPLAYRLLARIQVKCSLQGVKCDWKGDYGDLLSSHLLTSSAHTQQQQNDVDVEGNDTTSNTAAIMIAQQLALAKSYKEEGNTQFATGHYTQARDLYNKAIACLQNINNNNNQTINGNNSKDMDNDEDDDDYVLVEIKDLLAALHFNRGTVNFNLGDYQAAALDCATAISIDNLYNKAYVRQARALVQMGQLDQAHACLQHGLDACLKNESGVIAAELELVQQLQQVWQKVQDLFIQKEYASAKAALGTLLRESNAIIFVVAAASADLHMGAIDAASRLAMQVIKRDNKFAPAIKIRADCFIYMSEFDNGMKLYKEVMRLDPDNAENRRDYKNYSKLQKLVNLAKQEKFNRNFSGALANLDMAIPLCANVSPKAPLYAFLYTERAEIRLRLKQYDLVLKDCALVIYNRYDHVEAWLIRFQALHGLDRQEEALDDTKELLQGWGSNDARIQKAYEKADFEVRQKRRPKLYEIFGVSSLATEREIKKAYRQRALEMHPDRLVGDQYTDEQRKQAERDFHVLGEGLEILTDDFKRQLYDKGYDFEAIKERVNWAQHSANSHGGHHGYGGGHHGYH